MENGKIRLTLVIINDGIVETTFRHTSKLLDENDMPEDIGYQIVLMLSYLLVDSRRYFDSGDDYECFAHCIQTALALSDYTKKNKFTSVLDAACALMKKKLDVIKTSADDGAE